jgi:iron-sulfur cluster assembly protein
MATMVETDLRIEHQVVLTEKAAQVVREAFEAEKVAPASAFLRVGARAGGCSGYKFEMDYADADQVSEQDLVFNTRGINVVVDRTCLTDILGSVEIDYQTGSMVERGFKFRRLSEGAACGCGESFAPVKPEGHG